MFLLHMAGGALLAMAALSALAQAPSMAVPDNRAWPGHEPGVSVSLSRSNNAVNVPEGNPRVGIANPRRNPGVGAVALPVD
jgi:hypothetical protein